MKLWTTCLLLITSHFVDSFISSVNVKISERASGRFRNGVINRFKVQAFVYPIEIEGLSAEATRAMLPLIQAVACDIDGTCTDESCQVPPRVTQAIINAIKSNFTFFPATGKSRPGMLNTLGLAGEELKKIGAPGVFLQGLIVYGPGPNGKIIFERTLEPSAITEVVEFCRKHDIMLFGYSGDCIVCESTSHPLARTLSDYHEPDPVSVGSLDKASDEGLPIHKLILLDSASKIDEIRPELQFIINDQATLVQAMPHMLEVLPLGASKGFGVAKLLEHLKINPENLMAIGDAENDIEMLKIAGISVAMGNASPKVSQHAKFIAPKNSQAGAAVALEFFLNLKPPE